MHQEGKHCSGWRGYFNSNLNTLRWGIELVVPGRGVAEHGDLFKTKYAALHVDDHIVIDFTINETR